MDTLSCLTARDPLRRVVRVLRWDMSASIRAASIRAIVAVLSLSSAVPGPAQALHAPPVSHCFAGPYVLTFERNSSDLTAWHKEVLTTVLSEAKKCGGEMLIEGYPTDGEIADLPRARSFKVFNYLARGGAITSRVVVGLRSERWPNTAEDGRERHVQVFLAIWR
ncbi:hypothetical protein ABS767_11845 [Sphingomonas sp. ST-64]|uniref:OmpA-like domain-containing protein n=1 Tax=Sphingomonas plantiphila TaxID=3163295 RepID=A0ABW8YNH5_9SPHN